MFPDEMADDQVEQSEVEQQEMEDVFVLGDEVPPASEDDEQEEDPETVETDDGESTPAPQWVKDLRKESKETKRLLKQREAELDERKRQLEDLERRAMEQSKPAAVVAEPKLPKLEDFDYDEDKHSEAMRSYAEQYASFRNHKANEEVKQQQRQQELQARANAYHQKKLEVTPKLKDFAEVEQRVISSLPQDKQLLILQAVETNPELVVYALGKNPPLLREFADEQDPVKLGFKLGQISRDARLAPRAKKTPTAEPSVAGSGSGATNHIDRMLDEARKTGDYTAYREAKRRLSK